MRAWRSWRSAKGVALLAVAALAVGIGSTTAIYTVVHTVLLKPLPYRDGERFVALYSASLGEAGVASVNYADALEYQRRTHSFDVFGWFRNNQFNLTSPGRPEHILGIEVTTGLSMGGLAAVSLPARVVGGDYYDFFDAGDRRIGIALADIAGKGGAAALVMSVVQASLRIIAAEGNISLPELAARMNRFLYRSTGSNSYATFFYAQLDERTRELR